MSFQLSVYTRHQWMRKVLHYQISYVQTEKPQYGFMGISDIAVCNKENSEVY